MSDSSNKLTSREPFEVYVQNPALNMSRLKEIERSPQHYIHRLTETRESDALTLGRAAHTAVLEPERFNADYVLWDRLTKNGSGKIAPKNGEQWERFQVENAGRSIIDIADRDLAMDIQAAVRADPFAMPYLQSGDPEVSMQWVAGEAWGLTPRVCKGRADWITRAHGQHCLVGLKTSRDCRVFQFGNQAAKLGYPLQWAWYFDGYTAITGHEPLMREIVVEPLPPHAVVVYQIPKEVIEEGRDKYMELLKILQECENTGVWPGPALCEQELSLPTWYYQQHDDLADLGLEAA